MNNHRLMETQVLRELRQIHVRVSDDRDLWLVLAAVENLVDATVLLLGFEWTVLAGRISGHDQDDRRLAAGAEHDAGCVALLLVAERHPLAEHSALLERQRPVEDLCANLVDNPKQ